MKQGESPSSTYEVDRLDEILHDFQPKESSESKLLKPEKKVKVKKRGKGLGLKKLFSSKKAEEGPNCTKERNIQVSGAQVRTVYVNCEGCTFPSNLSDGECRSRCVQLVGKNQCENLILDDGYYKREYGPKDTRKFKELYEVAEAVAVRFPDECGLCAKEHDEQVAKFKEAMIRDPLKLLKGGVEVTENQDMTVKGVEKEVCIGCQKRVEEMVERTFLKLKESEILKGYDFSPLVRPFFSNSRILFEIPEKDKVEDAYEHKGSKVVLSRGVEESYSIFPPEYKLSKQKLEVMKAAYDSILRKSERQDEKQFKALCRSEVLGACSQKGYGFQESEIRTMADDLVRCTMGLDVIELLLRDPNLQDVYINSPIDTTPLYVKHKDMDDCRTNIYLSEAMAKNIISKFRLRSGRSFSEVSPILDMELPEFGVRVNITGPPISPDGLAFAFRRASEEPWTLLRFIENRMISPLGAGLVGLMVNEESTLLMCGDRGSGKTSMLTALMGAMPTKYRILTMEDTFEIPVPTLAKEGGFRIQRMRIKPSTSSSSFEVSADDAMRSLLRMGDSAIVMGEVRGHEAKTLYEAMNVGGSGNCVLGTIHGKSPRSLLERVVYSLGVPPQSFKATDLVVIADRIRPGGGTKKLRRVAEIVEVRKTWKEPVAEKVFSSLMVFNRDKDCLEATENLRNPDKSEVICKIAGKRGVRPKLVLEDVQTRAKAYSHAVELFKENNDKKLLSMKTMVGLNQKYLQLTDESIAARDKVDYGFVLDGIIGWLDDYSKNKIKIEIKTKDGLRKPVQGIAQDI